MTLERLERQLAFIREIDKSKRVLRQTLLMDGSRRENDAEHAWHLAVMALVLSEHAADPELDLSRVTSMLLVHDLVEIDAGDTFAYDEAGARDKAEREQRAADRIFALLPDEQGRSLRALWEEFEARQTPEARFAAALDRLQPLMHNFATEGATWRAHSVTADRVLERNRHVAEGSPALWAVARRIIEESVARGYLAPGPDSGADSAGPPERSEPS